jgi:hypothetical protein
MANPPNKPGKPERNDIYANGAFDVEHAFSMFATGYCTMPAQAIYDKEALAPLMDVAKNCHIYVIGYTPIVKLVGVEQQDAHLKIKLEIAGKEFVISDELPQGLSLKEDGDQYYLEDAFGNKYGSNPFELQQRLSSEFKLINFEVKYIGQAYGQDGSRHAIDRLLKHETLQKISLKGVPAGHMLTLLLLTVQPNGQLITLFNPRAKNQQTGSSRIESGLSKLFNTTEEEQISLYEAALIRYFCPEFNTEFKGSFPSTNLKILQDCYKKDFCAVIAEICIDDLPFRLWSANVEPKFNHVAKHDLHKNDDRRMFFGL